MYSCLIAFGFNSFSHRSARHYVIVLYTALFACSFISRRWLRITPSNLTKGFGAIALSFSQIGRYGLGALLLSLVKYMISLLSALKVTPLAHAQASMAGTIVHEISAMLASAVGSTT